VNEVLFQKRHTSVPPGGGGDRSGRVLTGDPPDLAAPRQAPVTEPGLSYFQGAR